MTVLNTNARQKLAPSQFAGPGKSFPVNDATHARLAIGGATRSQRAGNISAAEAAKIKASARAKLAKLGGKAKGKKKSVSDIVADRMGDR